MTTWSYAVRLAMQGGAFSDAPALVVSLQFAAARADQAIARYAVTREAMQRAVADLAEDPLGSVEPCLHQLLAKSVDVMRDHDAARAAVNELLAMARAFGGPSEAEALRRMHAAATGGRDEVAA